MFGTTKSRERVGSFGRLLTILVMTVVALAATVTKVQAQVGGAAVVFLMIEPDSRTAGMGNAGVAVADNGYAVFWNPAGLGFQEGSDLSLTHSNWLPEFNANLYYEYLVGKHHIPGWGTIGAQITYLNLGETEGRDGSNNPTGTFRSYDLAAGLSFGTKISKNMALGTSARLIYSNLAPGQEVEGQSTKAGVSVGVDFAGLYRSNPISLGSTKATVSAGWNLANMGPKITYSDAPQADPIPTNLRFGYSLKFDFDEYNSITFANDFTKILTSGRLDTLNGQNRWVSDPFYKAIFNSWQSIDIRTNPTETDDEAEMKSLSVFDQLLIGMGAEYWYNNLFALRSGYFYENPYNGNRQFLTFGAGVRYNVVGVDFSYIYALEEDHPLSNTMRFSLMLNLK